MENDITSRKVVMARSSSCGSSSSSSRHLANVAKYKADEGKIKASLKWLVSRVYSDSYTPDGLRSLFVQDIDGNLQLSSPLIASLVNGSLYGQAASRIFRDAAFASTAQHGIGPVFSALSREGIDVRDADGNAIVEETLKQSNPLNLHAHLHMIDALMTAHLRSLVSIDKIVHAISNYTSVEKREEPLDCVDALLFWINKVCLLVRDDIEHSGLADVDELPTIPEMEDLYEDLCDGTCICALISFYRPDELPLREICFNDPMSVNDCRFNLELLSKFCSSCLPWNPFHFDTEDILYLHESLQPNINVFLSDLFQFFESHSLVPPAEPTLALQRRFVPIQSIPELRTQDIAYSTEKGTFGMLKTADIRPGLPNARDRASSLASQDSLMTNTTLQTKDSLSVSTPRPKSLDPNAPNVTHFAAFKDVNSSSTNDPTQQHNQQQNVVHNQHQQLKKVAEVRLQMEEIRRQLAQRQQMEMAQQEQRRCETGKDAFFKVMSKSGNQNELQQAQSTPIGRQNQPPAIEPMSPANDSALVAQFQQMANVTPGATLGYGRNQQLQQQQFQTHQQQLQTPQQQRQLSAQSSAGGQTPSTLMQTSTPYMTAVSSFHPMLSPIAHCPMNANTNGSFVLTAPLPMMGATVSQQPIFGSNGTHQQSVAMTPVTQQRQQQLATEQPHYAVPSELHSTHQQHHPQQYQKFVTGAQYGGSSGPFFGAVAAVSQQSSSSSQPMHLHMVNQQQQQQQIPPTFSYQQPMHHHQAQPQFHQPFYQQMPQHFLSNPPPMGFQQQTPLPPPHQQHYVPSPLPPPINTATMFPQPDVIPIPPEFLPQRAQLVGNVLQPDDTPGATFRLHQPNAPVSRLDPQLDLHKDLTNWCQMTYRDGDRPQRKTWAQKQPTDLDKSNPMLNISSSGNGRASFEGQTTGACLSGDGSVLVDSSPEKDPPNAMNRTYTKSSTDDTLLVPLSPPPPPSIFTNGSGSANNRSGGVVFKDVSEPNSEMTAEMQAKRRAILASQLRRKEQIMAKSEEKETEELDRLQVKMHRIEQAELRKVEREQRRQKLLEDYKKRKLDQELVLEPGSARTSYASSTISLNRGHSQPPPFGRPKSQSNMNLASGTLTKRAGRAQSNVADNSANAEQNGDGVGSSMARAAAPSSVAEPSLKLYAKQQPKSNRGLIMNALQYSVFPGHVSNEQRQKAQAAIAQSNSKHFLVLFRDQQCQYRGLYTWDQFSDTVHKIEGLGPKVCREPMMTIMFKYDSGSKSFGQIPTKHLSATIDGFVISDQYWQKPKIPYSGR